jgi:hypothetical protein
LLLDKEETAINIAVACNLLQPTSYMEHVIINHSLAPDATALRNILISETQVRMNENNVTVIAAAAAAAVVVVVITIVIIIIIINNIIICYFYYDYDYDYYSLVTIVIAIVVITLLTSSLLCYNSAMSTIWSPKMPRLNPEP